MILYQSGNKYRRVITQTLPDNGVPVGTSIIVDVYDVAAAFDVVDAGLQHALKKLLCTGIRGHKTMIADLRETIDAIERSIQRQECGNVGIVVDKTGARPGPQVSGDPGH